MKGPIPEVKSSVTEKTTSYSIYQAAPITVVSLRLTPLSAMIHRENSWQIGTQAQQSRHQTSRQAISHHRLESSRQRRRTPIASCLPFLRRCSFRYKLRYLQSRPGSVPCSCLVCVCQPYRSVARLSAVLPVALSPCGTCESTRAATRSSRVCPQLT